MKKLRFTILQQVILTILLIAIFPIFEGFCIFISWSNVSDKTNPIIANRFLYSFFYNNPYADQRLKGIQEECDYFADFITNNMSAIKRDTINNKSETEIIAALTEQANSLIINLRKSEDLRMRVIYKDGQLIADNATLQNDNYYLQQIIFRKEAILTYDQFYNYFTKFLNSDKYYIGHDYYDSPFYKKDKYEGSELFNSIEKGYGCTIRHSLEEDALASVYVAKPFYIDGQLIGNALISKDYYLLTTTSKEWGWFLLKFSIISLILSIPFIVFLIFRLSVPVKRLSKQTLDYSKINGKIEIDKLKYADKNNEIGDLSKSFSLLIQKLNKSIGNLESFSSDVVHELKNPITSICMNTELLLEDESISNKKDIELIQADAKEILSLLNAMRENAKLLNYFSEEQEKTYINLRELLENQKITISAKYPDTNIKIISKSNSLLHENPVLIDRLLINILDNAASFGTEVLVTVYSDNQKKNEPQLVVSIEDNGPGIPDEELNKIFKRFYSNREKTVHKEHSGLGLSNVKAISETINASIVISKSLTLGGTCFSIYFDKNSLLENT